MGATKTRTWTALAGSRGVVLLAALTGAAPAAAGIVAEWRMDETRWAGAPDEVRELVAGAHATAFGVADTTSGLVCRGGDFSANGITDYLALDNAVLNGRTTFSISVRARTANNGTQAIVSGARAGQNNELIMWFTNGARFRPFIRGSGNLFVVRPIFA
ncbi:MAG: hypothetical protein HKO62_03635 [Gammaproteobacteria bacterium]|nr:hypothetical protein [Gammaproteobacteria bacterium]